ncbi:MAG: type II toxin-antitoxin system prevent-host-death family antitoxin [Deltaproteobacteria bacterium]|nr:type II toxin-antitoxin system prevent-host-death family antitoxin [Deltaproteobacteria bacterium]
MVKVGVKELKAKLSSYVDKARRGERVVITERGREVALIVPISKERRAVESLVDSGKAAWSGGKPLAGKGVKVKGVPLAETVIKDRR